MYHILLVDDEILYLEFLKECIDWELLGGYVVDIATSGEEALDKLRENDIDIIYLDINMGKMTGLDVCKEIQSNNIHVEIVIMTAHDEFSFAKQAIAYNVADYLLKPFDQEEIKGSFELCKEMITAKRKAIDVLQAQEMVNYLNSEEDVLFEYIEKYNDTRFVFAILKLAKGEYYESTLSNIGNCYFSNHHKVIFLKNEKRFLIFLHFLRDVTLKLKDVERFYDTYLDRYPNRIDKILLSNCLEGIVGFKNVYENTLSAMENSFKFEKKILKYSDYANLTTTNALYSMGDIESLYQYYKVEDLGKLDDLIVRMFGLGNESIFSFQYVYAVFHSIIVYISSKYLNKLDCEVLENLTLQQQELIEHISSCRTNEQVKRTIKAYIEEVFSEIESVKVSSKKERIFSNIEEYLMYNFANADLSISQIASALFYESSYIRRIYKEQTGKTIMSRLEEIRLEYAKRLLDDEEMIRIAEVANRCGFSEPYYFSKRFKKYYGFSPSDMG